MQKQSTHTQNATLRDMTEKLMQARDPEDLFGTLDHPQDVALSRRYRFFASIVHPDHNMAAQKAAEEAFKRLQMWYDMATERLANGTYGQSFTLDLQLADGTVLQSVLPPIQGDLCDLYPLTGGHAGTLLKLVRHGRNNDLIDAEVKALRQIDQALGGQAADPLRAHFPSCRDLFSIRDEAGALRRAAILDYESDYVTLAQVVARYPQGIDAADAAWMFNRMLAALAKTHEFGLVHGAVLPLHFMIRPKDHNGMLIDWCYSVEQGETIKAISPAYKPFYPAEVLNKRPATAATDLYMAAMCLLALLGGDPATQHIPARVPKPIAALLRGCLIASQPYRANDAWELFDEFQHILKRLYGAPTFRPFNI